MKRGRNTKGWFDTGWEYSPYILPVGLKLLQNLYYQDQIQKGLLIPSSIMMMELVAYRNKEWLEQYGNALALLMPIKHHYFGSFLYNQVVEFGIDKTVSAAIAESIARFTMTKSFDKDMAYVSSKSAFMLLSAFTNRIIIHNNWDALLGDYHISRFVLRTACTSLMLLFAAYLDDKKKSDVIVDGVMLQLLTSVTPVNADIELHHGIKNIMSTARDFFIKSAAEYTNVASL
ncbi:MAG: hypothetical protein ACK5WS_02605 [Alphaproteobacteria bacterium]|jgi:hypothetical protein|nr:hypothetical protein [Candidatus Jidaibacter sp.]